MTFGVCKLTGHRGTFIKCHLLPKALTVPPERSEVRVEGGEGRRPKARYDSWFDKTIVTRKGEDVFEALDTFAITELRRQKLVWSSWGEYESICPISSERIDDEWGLRYVEFSDPQRLRLFCLSLLWRAAMTNIDGFTTITLPPSRIEILSNMLLASDATPNERFPVHLIQLRTRGAWHNQSPIKKMKTIVDGNGAETEMGTYRFYMDGLIIHIDDETDDPLHWRFKGIALGEAKKQMVLTRPYENSFQDELITGHMLDAINNDEHADVVNRIFNGNRKTRE